MPERHTATHGRRTFLKGLTAGSAVATTGLAGCTSLLGGSSQTLKTAVLTPFSGSIGWLGPSTKKGAEVALADLNEKSDGIDGVEEVEIRSADTERSPSVGIQAYQNLDAKDYDVVFGTTSTVMVSLLPTAKDLKLPVLCPGTTTRLNPVDTKWMWRTQSHDNVSGVAQALYANEQFGDRIAVVTVNVRGPKSFASSVADAFEALGGTVAEQITIQPDASSYRSAIERVQELDVDGVSLSASVDAATLFINNYLDVGAEFPIILSNDASSSALLDKVGEENLPTVYGQVSGAGPANDYFTSRFQEVHDTDSVASLSQQGYDSMLMILAAVQQAGEVSREAIVNQFGRQPEDTEQSVTNPPGTKVRKAHNIKSTLADGDIDLQGASTTINFDENKNLWGGIRVLSAESGSWEVTKTYTESTLRETRSQME